MPLSYGLTAGVGSGSIARPYCCELPQGALQRTLVKRAAPKVGIQERLVL